MESLNSSERQFKHKSQVEAFCEIFNLQRAKLAHKTKHFKKNLCSLSTKRLETCALDTALKIDMNKWRSRLSLRELGNTPHHENKLW